VRERERESNKGLRESTFISPILLSSVTSFPVVISKVVGSRRRSSSEAKHSTSVPALTQSREGESTSETVVLLQETMTMLGLGCCLIVKRERKGVGFEGEWRR